MSMGVNYHSEGHLTENCVTLVVSNPHVRLPLGFDCHIGVGSDVVHSTGLGDARAFTSGMSNKLVLHAFLCLNLFCLE